MTAETTIPVPASGHRRAASGKHNKHVLPVYSLTPFTMLDFPERTACIIWLSGCNMRCAYCHNPHIVKSKTHRDIQEILSFLQKRKGLLDGVVLSGGEASIWPGLPQFIKVIKRMGYAIKLDTNGLRKDVITSLLSQSLLDYIALDFKAPQTRFKQVTGVKKYGLFRETLSLLCNQKTVPFEVRTTVHTDLLDEMAVTEMISELEELGYQGTYYVQNFCADNNRPTLGALAPQKRELDITALPTASFDTRFRNFSAQM
jgi:pyruvate formate lyase activating enzyme